MKITWPSFWYLIVGIPLGYTSFIVGKLLTPKSEKTRMISGFRPIEVISTLQLGQLMGIVSVAILVMFILSIFFSFFHNPILIKVVSAVVVILYCLWGFMITLWVYLI